ncbi:peroxisomal biogenesis factor 11 [Hypoxylon sp. NC1633]|nr:peroxisomal biogenesis factor 11 [Hypoxylon sp. NC1633]
MSLQLEQFIKFTTDSVGLERIFRLLQSIVQILSSFSIPFDLLLYLLSLFSTPTSTPSTSATRAILAALNQRLGLARRFFRLFRSLESFHAAQKLYAGLSADAGSRKGRPAWVQVEPWLEVSARTFNGMYLLLEASTIVDALQVPGLAVWTPEQQRRLTVEGQRFWLFALVCGLLYNLLEMVNVLAYTPVPATGEGFGVGKQDRAADTQNEETFPEEEKAVRALKVEQERLRKIVKNRKEQRRLWRRAVSAKITRLGRGAMANALDIVLPGTVVGWVQVEPGTVSLAMFVTTILTGMDVWERCGREVLASKEKAAQVATR